VLTLTEAQRALVRARASGRLLASQQQHAVQAIATFARKCDLIALTQDVLARAGRPFPREPVRTLDAIHLASVEVIGEPPATVTILTRDLRVSDNAKVLGYNLA
jgi:hypothetical protein